MIVYEAYCIETGKSYIGLTTKELKTRRQQHESYARRGSNTHFHRAMRKYGFEAFEWSVSIIATNISDLKRLEKMCISLYERCQLMNETDGGDGTFGRVASDETRRKISMNHADFKGEKHPRYGKPVSNETREKIRNSLLARRNISA